MSDQEDVAALEQFLLLKSPADFAQVLSASDSEPWFPYRHLMLINEKLVDLAEGRITRLMITLPPRHGKTWLCSVNFPAWYLNRWPDRRVILASYGDDFAAEWGRKVRDLIDTNDAYLNIRVSRASSAADVVSTRSSSRPNWMRSGWRRSGDIGI